MENPKCPPYMAGIGAALVFRQHPPHSLYQAGYESIVKTVVAEPVDDGVPVLLHVS